MNKEVENSRQNLLIDQPKENSKDFQKIIVTVDAKQSAKVIQENFKKLDYN